MVGPGLQGQGRGSFYNPVQINAYSHLFRGCLFFLFVLAFFCFRPGRRLVARYGSLKFNGLQGGGIGGVSGQGDDKDITRQIVRGIPFHLIVGGPEVSVRSKEKVFAVRGEDP